MSVQRKKLIEVALALFHDRLWDLNLINLRNDRQHFGRTLKFTSHGFETS